jgi:hypothetical protein
LEHFQKKKIQAIEFRTWIGTWSVSYIKKENTKELSSELGECSPKRIHSDGVRKLEQFYKRKIQATEFRVRREAYNEQLRALGCWRVFVHDPYAFACSSTTAPKKQKKQEQI